MEEQARNQKTVWAIVERTQAGVTKSYWTRVGVGFVNRDGSLNLHLDAIPISGKLQVREWEPLERRVDGADAATRARPRTAPAATSDSLI
jgi:hypothetical protein